MPHLQADLASCILMLCGLRDRALRWIELHIDDLSAPVGVECINGYYSLSRALDWTEAHALDEQGDW